jgi:hypothetical protein
MRLAILVLVALSAFAPGCSKPEEPGTPGWSVQQASAAARKKDWNTYVTHFTKDEQRAELVSCISTMLRNEDARRLAREEGAHSIAAVNVVLGDDSALKKKYKITQEWIDEVDSLEFEEGYQRIKDFVATIEDPATMWVGFIRHEVAVSSDFAPLRWGRIDKVEIQGDTAVVHSWVLGSGTPIEYAVDLKKVDGEWKIENK